MAPVPAAKPVRAVRVASLVRIGIAVIGALTAAVIIGLATWTHASTRGARWPAAPGQSEDLADVPASAVALVLGAEVYSDGSPSAYLQARLDLAADLWAQGKVRVLIVSGAEAHDGQVSAMARYLVARGVPAGRIVQDPYGFDTYDSCARARRIYGVDDVTVVSQAYHLPRALTLCRSLGLTARGVGDVSMRTPYPVTWLLGTAREYAANVKMVVDLVSGRDPVLGPTSDEVQRALATG